MIQRLFLHAGLPKTGSTSMQRWFLENRNAMRACGCDYPTIPALHNYKQGYVVSELRGRRDLPSIREALSIVDTPDALLSNEGISNHFHDFPDETLALFRDLTQDVQVVIIMFRRDPEAWLRSYHRQAVLNPRNNASELWGTHQSSEDIRDHYRVRRLVDTSALATRLTEGFGADACHVLDFDADDAFDQMLRNIGLDALAHIPLPRINEAIPVWAIEMMRYINAETDENSVRRAWKALLYHFLDSNHTVLRDDARTMKPSDINLIDPALFEGMPSDVPVQDLAAFVQLDLACSFGRVGEAQ